MKSRILAALAFTGLLMTGIPLTASANGKATCANEPAWGYRNPHLYRSWRQMHCGGFRRGYGYGYGQNYLQNFLGNGGWLAAPAYGQYAPAYNQYQGPSNYADRDEEDDDDGGGGWGAGRGNGGWNQNWGRGHNGGHGWHFHHGWAHHDHR